MSYEYHEFRDQILKVLERVLKPKRLTHTLGVETTAIALARLYHVSDTEASIAALLHDIAKNMDQEILESLVLHSPYGELLSPIDKYPQLLHAFAGAEWILEKYPQVSEEIVNAVRFHTTGRPYMGTLEKIIFVSDYIEPGRKPFPGLETAREATFKDLDQGVSIVLKQTLEYLKAQNQESHILTSQTYAYMQEFMAEQESR